MKPYHLIIGLLSGSLLINTAYADINLAASNQGTSNTISNANNSGEPLLNEDNTVTAASTTGTSSITDVTPTITRVDLSGDEHVVWDKRPISFEIPSGKERMISFPDTIELINNNPDLTADKLTVTINNGTLYAKALQAFAPIRVSIKLQHTGETVLLDISSADEVDDAPLDVVMASSANNQTNTESSSANNTTVSYIDLLRFAIQSLYAPERLISQSEVITRVPMYTQKSVDLLYGGNAIAMPIVSWQGGDYFVTAVIIKNTQAHSIILDPRQVKGNWLAAAFYPTNKVAAIGTRQDKTTLFLISNSPFGHAFVDSDGERK